MLNRFSRTELLFGQQAVKKLKNSRVAVFGLGGVGGYVLEALARSGVGAFDLIDNDRIDITNINRQILATEKTLGRYKTDVAKERILDINPDCKVNTFNVFFLENTKDLFDFKKYDYVVDAIDTVSGKKEIILCSKAAGVPVISSMGTGNKVDPTAFKIADIYKTSVCPLAKVMRGICRKNGIDKLKVLYSTEQPILPDTEEKERLKSELKNGKEGLRRDIPASNAFVPSVAGLLIAGEVIKDLISFER